MQDHTRTGTYQRACLENRSNFEGKVVMDVGTGSGLLAFFAVQAGAKIVYAVEASDAALVAQELCTANGMNSKIKIIKGKVEEIELPEKVDVIISEPIGCLLVHERMIESYIAARDRFLKPGGLMLPTVGSIVLAPFSDAALYADQLSKAAFWDNANFYGVDLTSAKERAVDEYMSQPIVGYFNAKQLISGQRTVHSVDFQTVTAKELQNFCISYQFRIDKTDLMHGIAAWFDLEFNGSDNRIILSTAPDQPGTHWYQCRLLLREPMGVNRDQTVSGRLDFEANDKASYFLDLESRLDGTAVTGGNKRINLHDQMYHYLYGGSSSTEGY